MRDGSLDKDAMPDTRSAGMPIVGFATREIAVQRRNESLVELACDLTNNINVKAPFTEHYSGNE